MKGTDFCPTCRYYLYLDQNDKTLRRICRNCGYQTEDKKGGLILEIDLKQKTSEGYKILMNEFTKKDPTLPHVNTIKCPKQECISNQPGQESKREVIYIRYDDINMKYIYVCAHCDTMWKTDEQK